MNKYLKLYESHSQYVEPEIKPNVSYCKQENEVHYNPYHNYSKDYFTIESLEDNNTIYWEATSTEIKKTISASTDNGQTWTTFTASYCDDNPMAECLPTEIATLNVGEKVLIKGENSTYAASRIFNLFKTTGQFEVKGNIMSLVSGDSFANADELTATYTFSRLFYQCIGLTSAKNLVLPATTLANYCYNNMFYGCTSLTTAPELPATTLAKSCYASMFNGCTSLTTVPELPATTLAYNCYSYMFRDCTSLITAPELPATTLAEGCYSSMLRGCTSLTTAPVLTAITLADYCYESMFRGCTNLTVAPELPATTLVGSCYQNMFNGCTSLNSITCLATNISASNCTTYWVDGVAASGTFTKAASISTSSWTRGTSGIPNGWTVQTVSE